MATGVQQGFAVLSTDAGTRSNSGMGSAAWAENAPEKVTDWGWRALHESVVAGKAIVKQFYSTTATFNYYMGCSTGGRQGLKEAQMFPDDFDGIVAGAPAWWTVHLQLANMKVGLYNLPVGAPNRIEPHMFPIIEAEVARQCDPQDGVTDGIISDPRVCRFRPETMLCGAGVIIDCLTMPQIQTLNHLYNDWVEANHSFIFPRQEYGSEWQWPMEIGNSEPASMGTDYVKYMLGKGPSWRWQDFNPEIIKLSERVNPGNATADDFDMSPFQKKGGKLLHYHGLSDGSIVPGSSVHFYEQVLRTLKPKGINLDDFYRFYLIPGMGHCGGTSTTSKAPWYIGGPNQAMQAPLYIQNARFDPKHNVLHALMQWVENGTAPEDLIASSWEGQSASKPYRQRPICVYPKQAKYKGFGDEKLPSSWECSGFFGL
jgi:feruloyl esterase